MVLIKQKLPTREGKVTQLCEIMNAFPMVLGIQIECLQAVKPLLETERVRKVAQDSALAHQVVSTLRNFEEHIDLQVRPNHAPLSALAASRIITVTHPPLFVVAQTLALHSLVLLARPIGGREGAVHIGMAPALPALQGPRGGIATVLRVMDRHLDEPQVQAMACWSLVNFALNSSCKTLLNRQGSVVRVIRAMETHPTNIDVQFRGLFAMINLVVPDTPNQPQEHISVGGLPLSCLPLECVPAAR